MHQSNLLIHTNRKRNSDSPTTLTRNIRMPGLLTKRQRSSAGDEDHSSDDGDPAPLARALQLLAPRPLGSLREDMLRC